MAKVTAKDANDNDVPVYQAQFNNRGEVESFLTVDGRHQKWVHARDYNVTVEDGEQPVEQPGLMTKDTRLNAKKVLQKTEAAPAADPAEPDAGAQDVSPADDGVLGKADLGMTDDEVAEPVDEVVPAADTLTPAPTSAPELPQTPTPGKPIRPAKK